MLYRAVPCDACEELHLFLFFYLFLSFFLSLFDTIFFRPLRLPFHSVIFIHEKELIEMRTMAENAATTILSLETVRYFATSS